MLALGGLALGVTALAGTADALPFEKHARIRSALAELREAHKYIKNAAHDFGGHRVDALASIDATIRQLEICLRY
jgi:predicted metal-dependent hydrolase